MSAEHHSISIHFAKVLTESAQRLELDLDALLDAAGLNHKMLRSPQLRITPDQFARLMRTIWQMADDEFMGMGSHPSRHGVFTLMAKQAVRCRNLRAVYHHLSHFYNLVADALLLEMEIDGNEVRMSMTLTEPDKDPDNALCEFLMLLWHRFPSWLIGYRIPLREIQLSHAQPLHVAEYRLMYPCPARFNCERNTLIFGTEVLDAPVVQTPRSLSAYLRRAPLDWFMRQAYYPVYTRQVLDYLERELVLENSTMEEVAQELHVSPRTLRRKLTDEGTSFQALKDGVRRDTAIHFLSQPAIPISQISRQLGFSEPAAFTRAFKQWTGVAPSVYRRN